MVVFSFPFFIRLHDAEIMTRHGLVEEMESSLLLCPQAKLSLFQLILAKYKQRDLHMSTYSLDADANTFDSNSSLGVCTCVLAAACEHFLCVCVCFFKKDLCQCGCTVFQCSKCIICVHVWQQECIHVCMHVCYTLWLTAAINRIKSKWARAPSWRLQSPPSQGRRRNIQMAYRGCICSVHVCVPVCINVQSNINVTVDEE